MIYGFGSFFGGFVKYQDIDILIVHRSVNYESCQFAISCKRFLMSKLVEPDITILSEREEQQFSFVRKSSAWRLGKVQKEYAENDLCEILNKIIEVGLPTKRAN